MPKHITRLELCNLVADNYGLDTIYAKFDEQGNWRDAPEDGIARFLIAEVQDFIPETGGNAEALSRYADTIAQAITDLQAVHDAVQDEVARMEGGNG